MDTGTGTEAAALSEFGDRLQLAREEANLAVVTVAEAFGVTRQAVMLWESGKRQPDYMTVWRLEVLTQSRPGALLRFSHPSIAQRPPVPAAQAIRDDDALTPFQRRALLAVLRAFQPER